MTKQHSPAEILALLPESERQAYVESLSDELKAHLAYFWPFWARPKQLAPVGEWFTWAVIAGRGFGKTRIGAEWVRSIVCGSSPLSPGTHGRIAIIGETAADARDVLVEGESGILKCHPKDYRPVYEPSKRRLTWPNGAIGTLYNATEPDQLRGPQHDAAWCDELAKWRYARDTYDQLQFGLRLGNDPRQCVTTTPRPIPIIREILDDPTTVTTTGSTLENRGNLAGKFLKQIISKYEGTRLGRQELNAEILDDLPGALWTRANIDQFRINHKSKCPDFLRIVVAVDPSGARNVNDEGADDIGIVVAAKGIDGEGYILEDATMKGSPAEWGAEAVKMYKKHKADCIVGERNYGGAMVNHVISTVDPKAPFVEVVATRGKVIRAEPVAALYEQGRIHHVGSLAALEDQMCLFGPDGFIGEGSPDRTDALVWALTKLFLDGPGVYNIQDLRRAVS